MSKKVKIDPSQCKGCGYCKAACPKSCIAMAREINVLGYNYAVFEGEGRCVGCGLCFYVCPEPGAICVINEKEEGESS